MTSSLKEKCEPIRLLHSEGDREVVFHPENEDRFCRKVDEIINTCQLFPNPTQFTSQFRKLWGRLAGWLEKHDKIVNQAFVTFRENAFLFLVVTRNAQHDSAFEDELTDLDMEIANDPQFNLISMNVLALPAAPMESIQSFLNDQFVLQFSIS